MSETGTGTHWRKLVSKDNPNLTVWDIEGKTPLAATIESTETKSVHAMGDGDEGEGVKEMLFLRFKGAKKALCLCATNASIIEQWHGPHVEGWVGKTITLRTAVCKREPCIRIDMRDGCRLNRRFPRFSYTDAKKAKG